MGKRKVIAIGSQTSSIHNHKTEGQTNKRDKTQRSVWKSSLKFKHSEGQTFEAKRMI